MANDFEEGLGGFLREVLPLVKGILCEGCCGLSCQGSFEVDLSSLGECVEARPATDVGRRSRFNAAEDVENAARGGPGLRGFAKHRHDC